MTLIFPYTNNIIGNKLKKDGIHVLSNLVNYEKWSKAIACPSGDVNYTIIKGYIDTCLLDIDKTLGWNSVMTKYRVSAGCSFDTSNSTDASALHRDLQQHSEYENFPVFTLIIYLDPAELKFVKGSHVNLRMSMLDTIMTKSKVLSLNPGDGVLFHASLLHGGIFSEITTRRVIQCFDIYPSPELARMYSPRILHIWCPPDPKESENGILMAKFSHLGISIILKYIAYILAARGYGHADIVLPVGIEALSGEAWRERLPNSDQHDGKFHKGNLYVIANALYCNDADEETNNRLRKFIYWKIWFNIGVTIVTFAILLAILSIITYKNRGYLKNIWKDIFKGKWGNSKRAETFYKIYALYIVLSIIRLIIWYYEYLKVNNIT